MERRMVDGWKEGWLMDGKKDGWWMEKRLVDGRIKK